MVDRRKIKSMVKKSRYLQWYVTKCSEFGSPRKNSTRQETVLSRSPEVRGFVKRNKGRSAFQSIYKQFVDGRKDLEECESNDSIGNSDDKSPNTLLQTSPTSHKGTRSCLSAEQQEPMSERSFFGEFGRYLNTVSTTVTTPSSRCETLKQTSLTVANLSTKHGSSKKTQGNTKSGSTEAIQHYVSNKRLNVNDDTTRIQNSPPVEGSPVAKSKCLPLKKRMCPSHNICFKTSSNIVLKPILKDPRPVFKRNLALSRPRRKISFAKHVDVAFVDSNGYLVKTSKTILKSDTVTEVVLPPTRPKPKPTPVQVKLLAIVKQLKMDRINGAKSKEDAMINTKAKSRSFLQITESKRRTLLTDPQNKKRKSTSQVTSPKRQKTTASLIDTGSGMSSKSGSETSPVKNLATTSHSQLKNAPVSHNDGRKKTNVKLKPTVIPTHGHDAHNSKHVSKHNADIVQAEGLETPISPNLMDSNGPNTQRCTVKSTTSNSLLEKPDRNTLADTNEHNPSLKTVKNKITNKMQLKTSKVATSVTKASTANTNKSETEKCTNKVVLNSYKNTIVVTNAESHRNLNDYNLSLQAETKHCTEKTELNSYEDATSVRNARSPVNTNGNTTLPKTAGSDATSVRNAQSPVNTNDNTTLPKTAEREQCVGKAELVPYKDVTAVSKVRSPTNKSDHNSLPDTQTEPCNDKTLLNSYEDATSVKNVQIPANTNDHTTSPKSSETEPCNKKTLVNSYEESTSFINPPSPANTNDHSTSPKTKTELSNDKTLLNSYEGARGPTNTSDHTTLPKTGTEHCIIDGADLAPYGDATSVGKSRFLINTENDDSSSKPKCLARTKVTSVRLFSCNSCDQRFVSLAKLGAHLPIHRTPQQIKTFCPLDIAPKENTLIQQEDGFLSEIMNELRKMNDGNDESSCMASEVGDDDDIGDNHVLTNKVQNEETLHYNDKNPDAILLHNRVDTIADVYHCNHCGRKFKNINNLKRHEAAHSMEKTYKCGFCSKMFSLGSERNKHEYTHVGAEIDDCSCK